MKKETEDAIRLLNERDAAKRPASPVPPADGEVEVLAVVTLGSFSSEELGDIDVEPQVTSLERLQQQLVTSEDVSLELVDGAHVTRLQAENAALQQRLNVSDQRVDDLQSKRDALNDDLEAAILEAQDWHHKHQTAQSELTKALSWLRHAKPLLHSGGFNLAADDIGNFLAHQSAPAAKSEDDYLSSCKTAAKVLKP